MTKLIPLAAIALITGAASASAENTFALDRARSTASTLALTNVQTDQASTLEVYAFDDGGLGRLLGSAPVDAGTTDRVSVALNQPASQRLLIVLMNGNHSVAKLDLRDAPTSQSGA